MHTGNFNNLSGLSRKKKKSLALIYDEYDDELSCMYSNTSWEFKWSFLVANSKYGVNSE